MAFVIEIISTISIVSAVLFYFYIKRNREYWKKKNVPSIKTKSIWGNVDNPLTSKEGINGNVKDVYDEFRKRGEKHGGLYVLTDPTYLPVDPELVKNILSKDFSHFTSRGTSFNFEEEPLAENLFNLDADAWRNMRIKFTPIFTSGKMKMMFPTLLACAVPMINEISQYAEKDTALDIKDVSSKFTIDVIGSVAFGVDCNSFKDPDAKFRKYGLQISRLPFTKALGAITGFFVRNLRNWLYLRIMSKEMEVFFIDLVKNIVGYRESNNFKRNDFIQLLMEVNEKAKANGEKSLTMNEMAAQCFLFFAAGFDTSSTTMTFCLHELAFNQTVQDKVREEIKEVMKKHDGKLTYDAIMEMKYMDKVINETLRKYPALGVLTRECTKDYKIPDTNVTLEKGTRVFISVLGLHNDEKYYPNATEFDPERFDEKNKATRHPFTYIPFGEGPRICIGLRFGLMQAKIGLSMILDDFRVLPAKGEPYDVEFDPKALVIAKKGNLLLKAMKIDSS